MPTSARPTFIWLASASPRRAELLDRMGIAHRPLLPGPDELEAAERLEAERPGEAPEDYVQRVTRAKLTAADMRWQERALAPAPLLCADTTVALAGRILGKPADAQEARSMLQRLEGRSHAVMTAVAVGWPGTRDRSLALQVSRVLVDEFPSGWLDRYIEGGQWRGKAGAYAIQGSFATQVVRIEGSESGIMGLPLYETARLLRRFPLAN